MWVSPQYGGMSGGPEDKLSLGRTGRRKFAMADRANLLERICVALDRPGVDGVPGSADLLEDLLLLGTLDGKYRSANTTSHRSTHTGSRKPPRFSSVATAIVVR